MRGGELVNGGVGLIEVREDEGRGSGKVSPLPRAVGCYEPCHHGRGGCS